MTKTKTTKSKWKTINQLLKMYPALTYSKIYKWAKSVPELYKQLDKSKALSINEPLFTKLTQGGRVNPKKGGIQQKQLLELPTYKGGEEMSICFNKKPTGNGTTAYQNGRYYLRKFPLCVTSTGKTVYVTFTYDGTPTVNGEYKSYSCTSKQEIDLKKAECMMYREKVYNDRINILSNMHVSFAKALEDHYQLFMKGNQRSLETQARYENWITKQVQPFFSDTLVRDVTADMLQSFINQQTQQRNYKDYHPLIISFFRRAFASGDVARNLGELVTIPKEIDRQRRVQNKRTKYIPQTQEVERLLNAISKDVGTVDDEYVVSALLLVTTGCRIGEILAVRWENVDPVRRSIKIKGSWNSKNGIITTGKNKYSEREATYPIKIANIVQQAKGRASLTQQTYILQAKTGKPKQDRYIRNYLKRKLVECKLPNNITPHSFRHWWAVEMVQQHPNQLQTIKQQGGWSDIRMITQLYANHCTSQELINLDDVLPLNTPKQDNIIAFNG